MAGSRNDLGRRLKEIERELKSVKDEIRHASKQDPAPAEPVFPPARVKVRSMPCDPVPEARSEPMRAEREAPEVLDAAQPREKVYDRPAGQDRRFANYLASSFQVSQTAEPVEHKVQRNKAFVVKIAALVLLWLVIRLVAR